jgi:hypothetical protein
MTENKTRKIIVVLGAGRCGTSLLMQVLSKLGMSVSENLVSAKAHNTLGPMEDVELANVYNRDILPQIGSNRVLPIPYDNFTSDLQNTVSSKLKCILEKNINASKTIWGFKDPYTACLLPVWFRILNQTGIIPVFLLAVRNPAQSAISRSKHFGVGKSLGELAWLVNYTDALHYTSADCFLVHYENWFSEPIELAKGILQFTGLDQYFNGDLYNTLSGVIKPNLNRAVYEDYTVKNEYVLRLYDVFKECRGTDFDRTKLMQTVKECRTAIDGFKGWSLEAQKHLGQRATLRKKMQEKTDRLEKKQTEMENLKKKLQQKENRLDESGKQVTKLKMELNQFQNKVHKKKQEDTDQLEKKQTEMEILKKQLEQKENCLDESGKQIKDLKMELNQFQNKVHKKKQEDTDRLEKKQTEMETLKKQLQQKENRLDEAMNQVTELKTVLNQVQNKADARVEKLEMKIVSKQREKEEDLQELLLQNNEYLRQMKALHEDLNSRQQEQDMLREKFQEKVVQFEKECKSSDKRQIELETLKRQYQQTEKRLNEVEKLKVEFVSKQLKMEEGLQSLTLENAGYLRQMKALHDENENLSGQIFSQTQRQEGEKTKNKAQQTKKKIQFPIPRRHPVKPVAINGTMQPESRQLQKWKREAIELRYSYSFRLGQVLINAVIKPGKNTLLMPYYLTLLTWDIISGRGEEKVKQALEN